MSPFQIVKHEAGPEPHRAPFMHVAVYLVRTLPERLPVLKKLAVMFQVLNTHFKTVLLKLLPEFPRHSIFAFRNEIK